MDVYRCYKPFPRWYFYENKMIISYSIFVITGVCAGFPALLWAFRILIQHHKSGGGISFITIFLLFTDLLELILSPILIYICKADNICINLSGLLFGARLYGYLLHQLVSLESILPQKYPSLAVLFSPIRSVILCIFVCMLAIGCQFLPGVMLVRNVFLCELPVIVCVVTCIVTCKASPDTNQATDRKPGVLVLSVAMFTLFILYVPFYLHCFFDLPMIFEVLVSMRLISEPILCVLVCRENHRHPSLPEQERVHETLMSASHI